MTGSLVVVDLIGDLRRRNYTLKRSHFFAVGYDSRKRIVFHSKFAVASYISQEAL
ncbi:MAG: hypothetical protein ICV63_19930 [Coleofasciculus sp. Co-bin14]|nr:hypothetical protein [Coleofasciculus sp. Co-bin14]